MGLDAKNSLGKNGDVANRHVKLVESPRFAEEAANLHSATRAPDYEHRTCLDLLGLPVLTRVDLCDGVDDLRSRHWDVRPRHRSIAYGDTCSSVDTAVGIYLQIPLSSDKIRSTFVPESSGGATAARHSSK